MADNFKPCSVADCNGNAHHSARGRKGLCCSHYGRLRRHGDPEGGGIYRGSVLLFIREVAIPYKEDGCLVWPFSISSNGYGQLNLEGNIINAHRYVCRMVSGEPPSNDHEAAHSCGNRECVNPNHLSWKTSSENQLDKIEHGTHTRGERHPLSKLTSSEVSIIKGLIGSLSLREIAARFSVHEGTIRSIKIGKSWSHTSAEGS